MFIYFQILKKQEIAVWQLDTTISQMLSNEMFYICISWVERTNALITVQYYTTIKDGAEFWQHKICPKG